MSGRTGGSAAVAGRYSDACLLDRQPGLVQKFGGYMPIKERVASPAGCANFALGLVMTVWTV
jgi:hypothetical protein